MAELATFVPGAVGSPEDVPEFDPAVIDLDVLVEKRGETYLAVGRRQLTVMREGSVVRVPDRLLGRV